MAKTSKIVSSAGEVPYSGAVLCAHVTETLGLFQNAEDKPGTSISLDVPPALIIFDNRFQATNRRLV